MASFYRRVSGNALAILIAVTCTSPLNAQTQADSIELGRAVAREILKELRPAPADSTICRAVVRTDSVGRAIVAGFVSEVQSRAWILAVRDFRTPRRGWTVRDVQQRGDSAFVTVRESGSSLDAGGHWYQNDLLYRYVLESGGEWRALPHQGQYFSDGILVSAGPTCRPVQ